MSNFVDCIGREVKVGDHVGVAFSFSKASVGYIRLGEVVSLEPFHMKWDKDGKTSPKMVYDSRRMVVLNG